MSRYQRPVTCFYAKVAGVTYDNRQAAIAKLTALEMIDLVPEPDNPHDTYAVKVCRRTGEQIGYLKRERARKLVEKLELGHRCSAFVKRFSGGETHSVSITVLVMSPEATNQEVVDWINRYDVLSGIALSLSPEGKLLASPAVDLVPDVAATSERRRPALSTGFEPPTARQRIGLTLRFHPRRDTAPGWRGWPIVVGVLILALVIIVFALLRS